MSTGAPGLVLAAHGTRDPRGPMVFEELADRVRRRLPGRAVAVGFVDVIGPTLQEVLADVFEQCDHAVVVPVFLGTGYHVEVDIPRTAATFGDRVRVAPALGPAPEVVQAVHERFLAACASRSTSSAPPARFDVPAAVVLAAAGSSRERSRLETEEAARALAHRLHRPVTVGFASAASPTVAEAVRRARRHGATTVGLATYLLAPGTFHDRLREAGADLVAPPVSAHPGLAGLVIRRYRQVRMGPEVLTDRSA